MSRARTKLPKMVDFIERRISETVIEFIADRGDGGVNYYVLLCCLAVGAPSLHIFLVRVD